MPNGLNSLFEGLFSGAEQVGNKLIENNRKGKLEDLYNTSLNKLNEFLNPQATYQQNGQQISRSQVSQDMLQNSQNGTQSTVQQTQTPDVKGAMNFLYQQAPKFNSEDGKGYLGLLNKFFENSQPTQPEYDIREVGGQLVRYDKNNPSNMEVVFGDKKPEKTVYNQKFYESQTPETIKNLTPDQIKEGYFYLPKELQDQLYSNPEIKDYVDNVQNQGDYTKKPIGGHKLKGSGKLPPISFGLQKDDGKFNALDAYNERIRGGEELSKTEQENYNTLRLGLSKKYDLNDTQLAGVINRLNGAKTQKEKNQILESLDKGTYYEDKGTSQEQIDYDRDYLNQWLGYLRQVLSSSPSDYEDARQQFNQYLDDWYSRGSITKKEYNDYKKSYQKY